MHRQPAAQCIVFIADGLPIGFIRNRDGAIEAIILVADDCIISVGDDGAPPQRIELNVGLVARLVKFNQKAYSSGKKRKAIN